MTVRVISGVMSDDERLHTVLKEALRRDGGSPEGTITLLGKVVEESRWKHLRRYSKDGNFSSFTEYVGAPVDDGGLGLLPADVKKLLEVRTEVERRVGCVMNDRAAELEGHRNAIRMALDGETPAAAKHGGDRKSKDQGGATILIGDRNTHDGIVSRLKRDDPELAESVVRGEITANAAARAKGWRYPRVELRNPNTVAARIKDAFTPQQIAQLVTALTETEF